MKKSVLKGALLLTSMIALAVPAGASATVWGPVGSTGTLQANSVTVTSPAGGGVPWQCNTAQQYGYHVRNPASGTLDITSATLGNCFGTGVAAGCTITQAATGLPWTAVAPGPSYVNLNIGNVNLTFSGASCYYNGLTMQLSGTIVGTWSAATHTVTFNTVYGLTLKCMGNVVASGGGIAYASALRDVGQTLTVT